MSFFPRPIPIPWDEQERLGQWWDTRMNPAPRRAKDPRPWPYHCRWWEIVLEDPQCGHDAARSARLARLAWFWMGLFLSPETALHIYQEGRRDDL